MDFIRTPEKCQVVTEVPTSGSLDKTCDGRLPVSSPSYLISG